MSYLLPKRRLRTLEVLEPTGINEDIVPAAERLSGKLNEHNFTGTQIKNATPAVQAYYKPHWTGPITSDPHFGAPGAYTSPDHVDPKAWLIPNSGDWEVVGNGIANGNLSLNFTTGNVSLWIVGWLQYIWLVFDGTGTHNYVNEPARVQFAIRLDGRVIESTITGQRDPFAKSWIPVAAVPQRTAANLLPGPQVPKNYDDNSSIGPEMMPVRLGYCVDVSQGEHTVEVVCRRVFPTNYSTSYSKYKIDNVVYVYTRKLFVLQKYVEPQATTTLVPVTVEQFKAEDTFSAASVGTNRVNVIRTASNSIQPGNAARGCFNNNHLPSAILDCSQDTIQGNAIIGNSRYPGFMVNTITANLHTGATGWYLLNDGAGNNLDTTATHPAAWNVSGRESMVLVFANVQLRGVHTPKLGPVLDNVDDFVSFAIGYRTAGATNIFADSICFANSYLIRPNVSGDSPEEIDVALFAIFDFTNAAAPSNYDFFGVYGSSMRAGAPNLPDYTWQRGSIQVIQLRD